MKLTTKQIERAKKIIGEGIHADQTRDALIGTYQGNVIFPSIASLKAAKKEILRTLKVIDKAIAIIATTPKE